MISANIEDRECGIVDHFTVAMEFVSGLIVGHWKQVPKYILGVLSPFFKKMFNISNLDCIHFI